MDMLVNGSKDVEYRNVTGNTFQLLMPSSDVSEDCIIFRFVFYTIIIGSLTIFGILGNSLSIAVLQKDQNNRVPVFLLQSLAVADNFVLLVYFTVMSVIYGLIPFMYLDKSGWVLDIIPYIIKYVHPFGYMGQCGTIWITVLLAINRYIAVIKPYQTDVLCTIDKARVQVLTVAILSIAFNIPRFFQYKIIQLASPPGSNNTITGINETVIGEHSMFGVVYTNIIYTVLVLLVPLVILTYVNTCLIREIRKLKGHPTLSHPPLPEKQRTKSEEDNITFIMVIIIIVFLCCHTPDRIVQIVRYFFADPHQLLCGQMLYYVSSIANLLIVVNSSSNFIIYYLLRKRFRKILMKKVCAWSSLSKYKETPPYLENNNVPMLLSRNTVSGGENEQD